MMRLGEVGERRVVAAVLLAVSAVFVSPIFRNIENFGVLDWDWNLFVQEVPRRTILDHRQIPLWNPYEFGGLPMLGSPWSRWLSPSFVLVLVFGTVVGVKLEIWLHLLLGLSGAYLLARQHGLSRTPATLAACGYACGGWFPMVIASGMSVFLGAALIPWAFLALRRCRRSPGSVPWVAVVCTWMFFDGAAEPLAILAVSIGIHEIVDVSRGITKPRDAAIRASRTALWFIGCAAVKLLPALEYVWRTPRRPAFTGGFTLDTLVFGLLERGQSLRTEVPRAHGALGWGIDETGSYVGWTIILLGALGILTNGRRRPELLASLAICLWLAMGDRTVFGPWTLVHALPPFSFMRVPERFRFVFLLELALFAGLGLQVLRDGLASRGRSATATLLVASVGILDLIVNNRAVFSDAFTIPPVSVPSQGEIVLAPRLPLYDEHGFLPEGRKRSGLGPSSSLFPAVRAGFASRVGFDPLGWNSFIKERRFEQPNDLRSHWMLGTEGTATRDRVSPNAIGFHVSADAPGMLVVNQTFDRGWRSQSGSPPVSHSGLLAVPIPRGEARVDLVYFPSSFAIGAPISFVAGLLLGLRHLARRRGRPLAAGNGRVTAKQAQEIRREWKEG